MITKGFYNIVTMEGRDRVHQGNAEVLEVEGTMIKVRHGRQTVILNTAAHTFVSAEPIEQSEPENPAITALFDRN